MLSTDEKVHRLRRVSIFAGLPDDALREISGLLEDVEVPAGAPIFEKGEMGTCLYIIARGRVRVHDRSRTLNELEEGDVFGEMAVLDAAPRVASVTAVEETSLFRLWQDTLYDLMAHRAEVARGIVRVLSGRLRERVQDVSTLHDRKEEIERELEIGRQIQAGFLPHSLPASPGWEIAGRFHPAREVAGDFYDAFTLANGDMVGLIIADVAGKGVGAALFMALTRSLLRAYADQNFTAIPLRLAVGRLGASILDEREGQITGGPDEPAEATWAKAIEGAAMRSVSDTSDYIAHVHGRAHMFATVFFGALDVATGVLTYVNAGHEAPAVVASGRVRARLGTTGPAVGLLPDMPFSVGRAQLEPGDTLVMYTDGVTDAHDPQGGFFGEERLLSLLVKPAESPGALLNEVEAQLDAFMAGASRFDDITLLAVRRA